MPIAGDEDDAHTVPRDESALDRDLSWVDVGDVLERRDREAAARAVEVVENCTRRADHVPVEPGRSLGEGELSGGESLEERGEMGRES